MVKKAALSLFRGTGAAKQMMFVRDRSKPFLTLPGGKPEGTETIEQALRREISEEIACEVKDFAFLEEVTGFTPDGRPLVISLFSGTIKGTPKPSLEIDDIIWMSRQDIVSFQDLITPITTAEIFPCLARHNLF